MRYGEPDPRRAPPGKNQNHGLRPGRTRASAPDRRKSAFFGRRGHGLKAPSPALSRVCTPVLMEFACRPQFAACGKDFARTADREVIPGRAGAVASLAVTPLSPPSTCSLDDARDKVGASPLVRGEAWAFAGCGQDSAEMGDPEVIPGRAGPEVIPGRADSCAIGRVLPSGKPTVVISAEFTTT